jgi:hypothetical protein
VGSLVAADSPVVEDNLVVAGSPVVGIADNHKV